MKEVLGCTRSMRAVTADSVRQACSCPMRRETTNSQVTRGAISPLATPSFAPMTVASEPTAIAAGPLVMVPVSRLAEALVL